MQVRVRAAPGVVWALAACLWVLPASAADFYVNDVSTTGDVELPGCPSMPIGIDMSGCGKCERPCSSPGYLYGSQPLTAGDTVHLNTGTYSSLSTQPVLTLSNPAKAGTPDRWLTFTGPLESDGRPLRDAAGRPLVVFTGFGVSRAGVVVGVDGIRLQALGLTNFGSSDPILCGSAVRILPSTPVTSFSFVDLDVSGLRGACANAIDIDADAVDCKQCEVLRSRMTKSPDASEAIWILGQQGVEIAGNTIHDWGRTQSDAAIRLLQLKAAKIHHNVIRDNAGPAVILLDASGVEIEHNTFRHNARSDDPGPHVTLPSEVLTLGGEGHRLTHNVIAPGRERFALIFAGPLETADFNGYVLEPESWLVRDMTSGLETRVLAEWQAGSPHDRDSLAVDDGRFASDADLHLRSTAGRFAAGTGWVTDADTSPFLDRAAPTADCSLEPSPNGARANLGAYGNTPEASLTPVQLTIVSGDGQAGPVGTAFAQALVVQARVGADVTPAAVQGIALQFEIVEGVGAFDAVPLETDASGHAQVRLTPIEVGPVVVEVRVAAAPGVEPVRFTLTAGQSTGGGEEPPAERPEYLISCGCTQAAGAAPLAALLLLVGWTRRRRHAG